MLQVSRSKHNLLRVLSIEVSGTITAMTPDVKAI